MRRNRNRKRRSRKPRRKWASSTNGLKARLLQREGNRCIVRSCFELGSGARRRENPLYEVTWKGNRRRMSKEFDLRKSLPTDWDDLEELYSAAFPDEDLVPLLRGLLIEENGVFSFVAICDGMLVGHIVFTMCGIAGRGEKVGLLGPLAVSPLVQRQGIGSALIEGGLNRLKSEGASQVQVLGDPAYYSRLGFRPDVSVAPPYDLPLEWQTAWQSFSLVDVESGFSGTLLVPTPWREPTLWAP